mmetsp:Transcript_8752/g.28812  ORF Transcript_8752/g.28812 Transcript_8752/m.28812 type:complete len:272 (-) Transcript_8752:711-1526(-)
MTSLNPKKEASAGRGFNDCGLGNQGFVIKVGHQGLSRGGTPARDRISKASTCLRSQPTATGTSASKAGTCDRKSLQNWCCFHFFWPAGGTQARFGSAGAPRREYSNFRVQDKSPPMECPWPGGKSSKMAAGERAKRRFDTEPPCTSTMMAAPKAILAWAHMLLLWSSKWTCSKRQPSLCLDTSLAMPAASSASLESTRHLASLRRDQKLITRSGRGGCACGERMPQRSKTRRRMWPRAFARFLLSTNAAVSKCESPRMTTARPHHGSDGGA